MIEVIKNEIFIDLALHPRVDLQDIPWNDTHEMRISFYTLRITQIHPKFTIVEKERTIIVEEFPEGLEYEEVQKIIKRLIKRVNIIISNAVDCITKFGYVYEELKVPLERANNVIACRETNLE